MQHSGKRLAQQALVLTALVLVVALMTACSARSTTDDTTRYLLTDDPAAGQPSGGERLLRLKRIELASYLKAEGVIMQTSDIAVREARRHLWAEDLVAQLQRDLGQRLARQLDRVRVLGPDERPRAPERPVLELLVTVDRFQGRFDGYAVVGGDWQLRDGEGEVEASERFQLERPLARDGYPALVTSLKKAWATIVAGIADGVRGAWPGDADAN